MERAKVIDVGFSVADADFPDIRMEKGRLTLSFIDWTDRKIEVCFSDVISFRWQIIESFIEGEAFDRCHEIVKSKWLDQHAQRGAIEASEQYKHYKFNFNACGQFEVISSGFSKTEL